MPKRSNAPGDLGTTKIASDSYDNNNVFLTDQGWVYRHWKGEPNKAGTKYWDELIIAGVVAPADNDPVTLTEYLGTNSIDHTGNQPYPLSITNYEADGAERGEPDLVFDVEYSKHITDGGGEWGDPENYDKVNGKYPYKGTGLPAPPKVLGDVTITTGDTDFWENDTATFTADLDSANTVPSYALVYEWSGTNVTFNHTNRKRVVATFDALGDTTINLKVTSTVDCTPTEVTDSYDVTVTEMPPDMEEVGPPIAVDPPDEEHVGPPISIDPPDEEIVGPPLPPIDPPDEEVVGPPIGPIDPDDEETVGEPIVLPNPDEAELTATIEYTHDGIPVFEGDIVTYNVVTTSNYTDIQTYKWTTSSGEIKGADDETTFMVEHDATGGCTVGVTVTGENDIDGSALTASDDVTINVEAVPPVVDPIVNSARIEPPTATITVNNATVFHVVCDFNDTLDINDLTYAWSGPADVTFASPTNRMTSVFFTATGTKTLECVVTNNTTGFTQTINATSSVVTVEAVPGPPTMGNLEVDWDNPYPGRPKDNNVLIVQRDITFRAFHTNFNVDPSTITYEWTIGDGGAKSNSALNIVSGQGTDTLVVKAPGLINRSYDHDYHLNTDTSITCKVTTSAMTFNNSRTAKTEKLYAVHTLGNLKSIMVDVNGTEVDIDDMPTPKAGDMWDVRFNWGDDLYGEDEGVWPQDYTDTGYVFKQGAWDDRTFWGVMEGKQGGVNEGPDGRRLLYLCPHDYMLGHTNNTARGNTCTFKWVQEYTGDPNDIHTSVWPEGHVQGYDNGVGHLLVENGLGNPVGCDVEYNTYEILPGTPIPDAGTGMTITSNAPNGMHYRGETYEFTVNVDDITVPYDDLDWYWNDFRMNSTIEGSNLGRTIRAKMEDTDSYSGYLKLSVSMMPKKHAACLPIGFGGYYYAHYKYRTGTVTITPPTGPDYNTGTDYTFTASTTGNTVQDANLLYTWTATNANPASGTGESFTTQFTAAGTPSDVTCVVSHKDDTGADDDKADTTTDVVSISGSNIV